MYGQVVRCYVFVGLLAEIVFVFEEAIGIAASLVHNREQGRRG